MPGRCIQCPVATYTDAARIARISGLVLTAVVIDKEGRVRNPKILLALGLGLEEETVETFSKWKFEPAKLNGQPVAVQAAAEMSFRLQ